MLGHRVMYALRSFRACVLRASQGIGLTDQDKYNSEDLSSYKALFTNVGVHKDKVRPRPVCYLAALFRSCWLALGLAPPAFVPFPAVDGFAQTKVYPPCRLPAVTWAVLSLLLLLMLRCCCCCRSRGCRGCACCSTKFATPPPPRLTPFDSFVVFRNVGEPEHHGPVRALVAGDEAEL